MSGSWKCSAVLMIKVLAVTGEWTAPKHLSYGKLNDVDQRREGSITWGMVELGQEY